MNFRFEKDGWAHIMPAGEFPHAEAGVVQVIDRAALDAIVANFKAKTGTENFPGLLVDFDHFSMDTDKPSEAAGWVTELRADAEGLWAKVRWTGKGEAALTGGEYRLVSPVFPKPSQCEDLGGGRIRPRELLSIALTNEPNIKGARPLTNRGVVGPTDKARVAARAAAALRNTILERSAAGRHYFIDGAWYDGAGTFIRRDRPAGCLRNRSGEERLYKWVLGKTKSGSHCGDCASRAGQIKTVAEWRAMPAPQCKCRCSLVPV